MTALDTIKTAVLGNPPQATKQPSRQGTVQAFAEMQTQLEAAQAGAIVKDTLANLTALASAPYAGIMAWVVSDATLANNGIYENTGTAVAPAWTRRADIPQFFITAMNVGDGVDENNIVATTDLPVPAQDGRCMIAVNILSDNTDAMTVTINGIQYQVLSNSGNAITSGSVKANSFIAGVITNGGTVFRLFSDQAQAALLTATEAARDAAIAAQANAEIAASSVNVKSFADQTTAEAATISSTTNTIFIAGVPYEKIDENFWNLGPELVTNGTFAADTDWTKGTGWSIAAGIATKSPGTLSNLAQSATGKIDDGKKYLFSLDVIGLVAGNFQPRLTGAINVNGTAISVNGSNSQVLQANSTSDTITITANASTDGSVDNVSLKELPDDAFQSADGAYWGKASILSQYLKSRQTSQNWNSPFGGTWKSIFKLEYDGSDQATSGSYGALAIKAVVDGNGSNGPSNAALALMISAEVANWKTTTNLREIDGVSAVLRSPKNGDASLFLFNGKKVYDAASPYGMTGLEGALYWTDGTGDTGGIHYGVKITFGAMLNTTDLRGGGSGFKASALVGDVAGQSPDTAFLATGDNSGGYWNRILVAANGLLTTNEFFVIKGTGAAKNVPEIHFGPRTARIVEQFNAGILSWNYSTDGGSTLTQLMTLTTASKLELKSVNDSASAAPKFSLLRASPSPAGSDLLGEIDFVGYNSSLASVDYANIRTLIVDPTAASEDAWLQFLTVAGGSSGTRLTIGQGLFNSAAAGGDKGVNTINFGAVYDDNVLLTDYVFDIWLKDQREYSDRVNEKASELNTAMFDPREYSSFFIDNRRLWGMPDLNDTIDGMVKSESLGGMVQRLWQTAELNAIHVYNHEQRIQELEKRISTQ